MEGGFERGSWHACIVGSRLEFVLDGTDLSELIHADPFRGDVSIFDATDIKLAQDVLLDRERMDDEFPVSGRIPLMFCSCGDPGEGALTARLTIIEDTVTWDQWANEDDSGWINWISELPAYTFSLENYLAAVRKAAQMELSIMGAVSSKTRVRVPGEGLRSWVDKRRRGELACKLDLLAIEVVRIEEGEHESDLRILLEWLEAIRSALRQAHDNRHFVPTLDQRREVSALTKAVLKSPENFRLPWETNEALKWLRFKFRNSV